MSDVDGLAVVDKPPGWTSHDVVARVRKLAGTRRVGHAGTLDPMATGVLVLGVNRATRLLHHLALVGKGYTATIRLGVATSTDDAQGDVLTTCSAADLDEQRVRVAMRPLTGTIQQVPSTVSAIKVAGERAYRRARAGEAVELPPRPVTVSRFEAVGFTRSGRDTLDVDVEVECSSGTYVRALARDLGTALGVGGHLTALRRVRVGPFELSDALTLDELAAHDGAVTIALAAAVRRTLPVRELSPAEARELSFGRPIEAAGLPGPYGAFAAGDVVALLEERDAQARPLVVFRPAT
jgi:tRNA pseudouridine55 synthase